MNGTAIEYNCKYQMFLDNVPGALCQCLDNESYVMSEVNKGFLDMFGFSRDELSEQFQNSFIKMISHADRELFIDKLQNYLPNSDKVTLNCRVICRDGSYKWVIACMRQIKDENGHGRIINIMQDIDKEKQTTEQLRHRAERDALTGLYNREELGTKISSYLESEPDNICALLMIDTDNFKLVNDSHGHLFGDAVLTEMAAGMKKMMRRSDIVGRIGGDEFTVFLKDISTKEMALQRAQSLLDMFKNLFREEKYSVKVTCSIGVAVYPNDGQDFQSLYRSADLALYRAKSQGKNQYVLFDREDTMTLACSCDSSLGAVIDSDRGSAGKLNNLVSYVFEILYNSSDLSNAMQMILEIVGKRFEVSRAYIFENSEDGRYCNNTYEWCNAGITPKKCELQNCSYGEWHGFKELFKEKSVFYCRDVQALKPEIREFLERQGVQAILQCAVWDGAVFSGFVGFDECTGFRMWTKEEIDMLSLISQLLTTFLLKKRGAERDRKIACRLNLILDRQDAYVYTIKKGTYELLYLNRRIRDLDKTAGHGKICFRQFFGRDNPCENCPISGGSSEIFNPKYNVWTKVRVTPIEWDTYEAYLLTCYDITEYKQKEK